MKSNRRKEISNDNGPLRAVTVCCDDGPFLWHLALWTKRLDKRGLDNHDFVGVMLCCNSEVCNATPGRPMKVQSIHIEYFMCKHWCFKNVFEESNTSFEIHKVLTFVPGKNFKSFWKQRKFGCKHVDVFHDRCGSIDFSSIYTSLPRKNVSLLCMHFPPGKMDFE